MKSTAPNHGICVRLFSRSTGLLPPSTLCLIAAFPALVFFTACAGLRPLKPGHSIMTSGHAANSAAVFKTEMRQPENPGQSASQSYERITETELSLPKNSTITEVLTSQEPHQPRVSKQKTILLPEPAIE